MFQYSDIKIKKWKRFYKKFLSCNYALEYVSLIYTQTHLLSLKDEPKNLYNQVCFVIFKLNLQSSVIFLESSSALYIINLNFILK